MKQNVIIYCFFFNIYLTVNKLTNILYVQTKKTLFILFLEICILNLLPATPVKKVERWVTRLGKLRNA